MTHSEIIKKLIGKVMPAGDASIDPDRLENLKTMCTVTEHLIEEIVGVASMDSKEHSVQLAAAHAKEFLSMTIEFISK